MQQFPEVSGEGNSIVKIDLFKKAQGVPLNMIFTKDGLYNQNEPPIGTNEIEFNNLLLDTGYTYNGGFIDTKSVPNNDSSSRTNPTLYLICSKNNNIYYWDGAGNKCKKLEGTFTPPMWQESTDYNIGDYVIPQEDNGFMYQCVGGGRSGNSTPDWQTDLVHYTSDGSVSWKGVGYFGLEGSSAGSLEARFIEYYKGFTFVGNLSEDNYAFPSRVRWSQWQNPRLWHNNDDGSGMAGYIDVDDVDGQIMAIKKVNDILAIYKEKGIIAITFTGGDTVFSKELITTKTGLISSSAIVELPHSHIFVGEDNIYEFDGSSITPIGDPIKDYFFNNIIPEQKDKIIGYYDEDKNDLMFIFDKISAEKLTQLGLQNEEDSDLRTLENRSVALTYNISTKTWSKREMYVTAIGKFNQTKSMRIKDVDTPINSITDKTIESAFGVKDKIITICGDENGNVYRLLGNSDDRTEGFNGYVISKTHHMEDPTHIKRLLRIQFHIETASNNCPLVVKVGTGWNSESRMTQWETHNIRLGSPKPPFVDVDLSARYFQIKFGTENDNEYFKILGYTLYYQTRGDE